MMHLTPDEMVLHYYGESAGQPEEHLAVCEKCRAEYRALQCVLNAADGYAPPERDAGFEARLWARLEKELPARAVRGRWIPWRLLAAACVLALSFFYVGRWSMNPTAPAAADQDSMLMQAVGYHIDRSQYVLQEVANDPRGPVQHDEIVDLLGSNRLYRQTAAMEGEAAVVDLLEELEQVLLETENRDRNGSEIRGMLFKLRVAGEELRRRETGSNVEEDRL